MTELDWNANTRAQTVWRYMTFSRFVWLLQRRQLWLARADTLGDPWEIALAGEQLESVIRRHPISPLPLTGKSIETAMERVARIIPAWREVTFVNCWNVSEHESHALWRIYCGETEGIAIKSTLGKLRDSSGGVPIYPVEYRTPGTNIGTPTLIGLVTQKRPMFEYEREVRLVHIDGQADSPSLEGRAFGRCLPWNVEEHGDAIHVHPLADTSFMEAVTSTIQQYAPTLLDRVTWSAMREPPPV